MDDNQASFVIGNAMAVITTVMARAAWRRRRVLLLTN
jgi:hypothetical protein